MASRRAAKKRGPGRPAGPADQVRRNRITATFTDGELEDLEHRAVKADLAIARIIHQVLSEALGWNRDRRRHGAR